MTYSGQVEIVEYVTACFPHCRATVLLLAFVYNSKKKKNKIRVEPKFSVEDNERTVESVNLRYLPAFVIPAQQGHLVWVSCLES